MMSIFSLNSTISFSCSNSIEIRIVSNGQGFEGKIPC